MNEHGNLMIFNPAADYAYRLGVDDELKFRHNQKTYQEIIHEAAEIPYGRDEYVFVLPEEAAGESGPVFQAAPDSRPETRHRPQHRRRGQVRDQAVAARKLLSG